MVLFGGDFWELHEVERLLLGTIVNFIGGALCASVGIGGGGIYVPVLILILQLTPQEAVPISKAMIVGVALASHIMNCRKTRPGGLKPIIDYDVALLMVPMNLCGTVIGVYVYVMVPAWATLFLLVIVLSLTAYRTFVKAKQLYIKEASSDIKVILSSKWLGLTEIPMAKFLILIIVWGINFAIVLTRGGTNEGGGSGTSKSVFGIEYCTWTYWGIAAISVPFLVIVQWLSIVYLKHSVGSTSYDPEKVPLAQGINASGTAIDHDFSENFFAKPKLMWVLPIASLFAGVAAGFLGIGSGLVNGPVLLELGLPPEIATATSSFIILFTACSTTAQYLIIGALDYSYGLWYGVVGFICSLVGNIALRAVLLKYKKMSYISFLLGGVITLSAIAMIGTGIWKVIKSIEDDTWMFKSPC